MRPIAPSFQQGLNANERQVLERTHKILSGGVSSGAMSNGIEIPGNLDNRHVQVTTGAANTDFNITHNLGRVPTGFNVVYKNKSTDVWAGTLAWTVTTITVQASAATVIMILEIY